MRFGRSGGLCCETVVMTFPVSRFRGLCRVGVVLALFALSVDVHAAWVALGRNDTYRVYIDQNPVQRNGDRVQIVQLTDFVSAQWIDAQSVFWSLKAVVEYDCSQSRFRTLVIEAFTEQMGDGRKIGTEQPEKPEWEAVVPGSAPEKAWQVACKK